MKFRYKNHIRDGAMLIAVALSAIFLGSNASIWYRQFQGPFKSGDYVSHVNITPYKLTLYGTSTCQHCKTARHYLRQAGVPYNDVIIDQSIQGEKLYRQLGVKVVPVLVSEKKLFVGFSPEHYAEMVRLVSAQ